MSDVAEEQIMSKLSSCKLCPINSQASSLDINLSVELCPITLSQIFIIAVEAIREVLCPVESNFNSMDT